ncbi:MauE/DoxX family redox-associated membrane protein [Streptomyces hirsutus]|uniref:MauE/DoxX family redox-associated membrane protein n=1 Tax=Streptomyces hirsutus TaxID=35620 RepID=UPI0034205D4B
MGVTKPRTVRDTGPGTARGTETKAARITTEWIGTAARLLLAAVLGYAGLVKVQDLTEAGRTVALYRIVPDDLAQLVGGALPFVELALALLLVAGLATRAVAAATAALMVMYIAAITSVWARGLSIDCGCFSSGGTVTSGAERGYAIDMARDLVFLAAAVLLIRRPRTRYALDRWVLEELEEKER